MNTQKTDDGTLLKSTDLLAWLESEARKLDAIADSYKGKNIPGWYETISDRDRLNAAAETIRKLSANDQCPATERSDVGSD